MATQIIHFESDPECDGVKLFEFGSDTLAASGSSIVMGSNDTSHGTCEVEDVPAGLYKVITFSGTDPIGYQFVDLQLESGEYFCRDSVAGDVRGSEILEAIPDVSNLALEATAQLVKSQTDKLNFAGTGGVLKSESTNMRGTDNAVTSLSGVALEETAQSVKSQTDKLDFSGTGGALKSESTNAVTSLSGIATSAEVSAVGAKVDGLSIPSADDNATAIWSFPGGRTLSSFGTLVADIVTSVWEAANRTLTAFTHKVTVATNEDKSDYSLQTAPPTKEEVATQVRTELSPELGRLDVSVSSRATKASLDDLIEDIESLRDQLDEQDSDLGDIIDDLAAITNVLYQIVGASPGAFPVTLTIKAAGGALVSECDVVLTASNTSIAVDRVWVGRTDVNGVVSPELDPGTYYGWRQKPQYSFTNPFTLVVEDDGSYTVS